MTEIIREIDRMIADLLAGNAVPWPAQQAVPDYGQLVIDRACYHGLAGLLNKAAMATAGWPDTVTNTIHAQAISQGMWELRHKVVLGQLLQALHAQDIQPIILKGTAIAYDLYAQPAARQRGDTDLLIPVHALGTARAILRSLGYAPSLSLHDDADPKGYQENWDCVAADSSRHTIDLHWSVMDALALRDLFTYDDALLNARTLPRLHAYAQGFGLVDALLFSCVHRAKHLFNPEFPYFVNGVAYAGYERLIWAYDIDLYAKALQTAEWAIFCAQAHKKGIARICLDGLDFAAEYLGTQIPEAVRASLIVAPVDSKVWCYMHEKNIIKRACLDLFSVAGFKQKLHIIVQKLFPTEVYMRSTYDNNRHYPLIVLYCMRFYAIIFSKK